MPRPRIAMRKIREALWLAMGEELSRREASAASGVPLSTVNDYLGPGRVCGLKWPLPDDLDHAGLEALPYPPVVASVVTRPGAGLAALPLPQSVRTPPAYERLNTSVCV